MRRLGRPSGLRWVGRVLLVWTVNTVALILLGRFLPGLRVGSPVEAALATAVIGLLNAVFWPLLLRVLLPAVVYTLGLLALVFNGAAIWLAGQVVPGVQVASMWTAIAAALGLTAVSGVLSRLLAIDDDETFYRSVLLRLAGLPQPAASDSPGVLFLEIDGLAHAILLRAVRNGHMPTLGRWLESGSHRVVRWECDLSSQTSASQAGILLGNNFDVPAFRWYEKDSGQLVVTSSSLSAAQLERRLSAGTGLLSAGGSSVSNVFSGDAAEVFLTLSAIRDRARFRASAFLPYFARPFNFARLLLLYLQDVAVELLQARRQRRADIRPRIARGGAYPLLRAFTTVVLREMNVYALIGDMFSGVPAAYATFSGYDEVAHHSGPERDDALSVLEDIDRQFARLERAAGLAARPYHMVVLSDHGQSQGATFRQRYGLTFKELVDRLTAPEVEVESPPHADESWGRASAFLTESVHHAGTGPGRTPARLMRRAVRGRIRDGQVVLGPEERALAGREGAAGGAPAEVVVLASGSIGLIYLTASARRLSREEIDRAYPQLIPGLAHHPGVGFLAVRARPAGAPAGQLVVIGAEGVHYLDEGRVEGKDPLARFGRHAAAHLRRHDTFPHAPDILVSSVYDPHRDEIAAFEELVGSHGGLGGDQMAPFVLYPASWPPPAGQIVGPEALHAVLKGWLAHLGPPAPPASTPPDARPAGAPAASPLTKSSHPVNDPVRPAAHHPPVVQEGRQE